MKNMLRQSRTGLKTIQREIGKKNLRELTRFERHRPKRCFREIKRTKPLFKESLS